MLNLPSKPSRGLDLPVNSSTSGFTFSSLDLIRGKLVLVAQLDGGVDCRMHHDPAGEGLIGVQQRLVSDAQAVENLAIVLFCAERVRPAALGFDHLVRGGEVLRREQARKNTIVGGASGIEALVH